MKTVMQGWNRRRLTRIGAGVTIGVAATVVTTLVVLHYRNPSPPVRILKPISLDATPEDAMQQVREQVERTPPEQRSRLFAEMREQMQERAKAEALAYVKMNEEERIAYLDRRIDEFSAMMDRFREMRESGGFPGFRGGPGGPPPDGGPGGGPGFGSPPLGGGPGGDPGFGGRREPPTPGQQAENTRRELSGTTPQERAAMQKLWNDLRNRARERGISAPGGFGGR